MSISNSKTQDDGLAKKAITVWLCTALFYLYQFVIRVSPGVFEKDIVSTLGIDACTLGGVISFYYYGYSSMQIPAGVILDSIGVRRPLIICCLLCAAGAFLFASTQNLYLMSFARLLMGVGSAFGFISNVRVASLWFSPKRLSLMIGLTLLAGTLGAISANEPLAALVSHIGWQNSIYIIGAAGILMSLVCYAFLEDRFVQKNHVKNFTWSSKKSEILHSVQIIVRNPQSWIIGAYGLLMYMPLAGFGDLWGIPYLRSQYGIDVQTASSVAKWFYVGIGIGSPSWSWVLTYTRNYKTTMFLSAFSALAFFAIILYVPTMPVTVLPYLLFAFGCACGGQFVAFAAVTEINTPTSTATASGMHNMLCMASGVIAQPLIGYFLDLKKVEGCAIGTEVAYDPTAFVIGFSVITAGLLFACISCFLMGRIPYIHEERISQSKA